VNVVRARVAKRFRRNPSLGVSARTRYAAYAVLAAVAIGAATRVDGWTYRHFVMLDVYEHDWGRLLRMVGYLPTRVAVAAGAAAADRRVRSWREAATTTCAFVLYAATLGGLVAEPLKIVIRRDRPDAGLGTYVFRAWSDRPLSSAGFGMPSSHAIVAFGAAAMLWRVYPRGRALWVALAIGCAATRVASHAHFLSDVVVAAMLGPVVAVAVTRGVAGVIHHPANAGPFMETSSAEVSG
jgi:membrane-associated phospholipid phosphatase